jgi:cellulose synthase/poly-beta-1,6-N-acetylglucosamine synthase-like glycosyltransferase
MNLRQATEIIFWLSAAALLYTYAGYPLLLAVLSKLRPRVVRRSDLQPSVSVIITAYNEERDLAAKLENTLAVDYPKDRLEVIVASDCSTDRTDEIARSFAARGVRLHRQPERLGKTAAQNAAVELARGEIILFSDATTHYQPDVVRVMMASFADETVGCVTGRVVYTDPAESSVGHGTRSYWSYEFLLKKHESTVNSLIGVCGCLYAVRRSAYVPLYHEACSDFIIATKMVEQGLRAVYEPDAVCMEETNQEAEKELQTRVRIITQTFADLWRNRAMMNPFKSGFYAVQLISHKVMRYFVPLLLIVMLLALMVLAPHSVFYSVLLVVQLGCYSAALLAWVLERAGLHSRVLAIPQYFVLANVASLIACYKFARGERYARWEPIRDDSAAGLQSPTGATSANEEEVVRVAGEGVRAGQGAR